MLRRLGWDVVRRRPRPLWPEEISRSRYQEKVLRASCAEEGSVLDVGSGSDPLPSATVLSDRNLGRTPDRSAALVVDARPFVVADVCALPFGDKEFDFVYCSHVLEHIPSPLGGCRELVRVGRRGYIETPTLGKDALFAWARGMHRWHCVSTANKLLFFEYSERQLDGVRSDAWRKRIFAAYHDPLQDVYYNNPEIFNVMFSWEGEFECWEFKLSGETRREILS